jgi:predicted transcriptional regulator
MSQTHEHILSLAARIVSAHVGNNDTSAEALPTLIRRVYDTLADVGPPRGRGEETQEQEAASVDPDQLVCLECGIRMKMLKRHLVTVHNLSPEEYRQKHNLAADVPMVASNYAALRSSLAKQSGLGKRPESLGKRGRANWR